jgi:Carbohydrate esterase, sialic acid-specific acetylesterase
MKIRLLSLLVLHSSLVIGHWSFAAPAPATVTPPDGEHFHIYLLMGQSNMAGRDRRQLEQQTTDPRVLAMTPEGQWQVARDPMHQQDGRTEPGAGPGIPFALGLLKTEAPTVTIGLVPCAVGGTPLKRWVKGGDLYARALERARLASRSGTLAGMIWLQGETDSDKQPWAERYETSLAGMIANLRQDLGQPELPVVVGQIGEFLTVEKHPYVETVRTAIRQVAATVPHVGYADSAGLGDKGDKLHYSADAQSELGARFAEAMRILHSAAK